MSSITKGLLLFNTVKYLKLSQLVNQVKVQLQKPNQFWKYKKKGVNYKNINLWIEGLDDNKVFMNRFKPEVLLDNKLTLLNETRDFDTWQFLDASHLWNFNVHYLEYLVPLYSLWKSIGDERYKEKINEVLDDWYERGSKESDSNQSYTISLRVINQLIIVPAIDDKQRLYDSIYAQYQYLMRHQEKQLLGNHYLENLKAIVICSLVFGEENIYRQYIKCLLSELEEQITADGLHYELSLMYHKIVLEDLIRVAIVMLECGKHDTVEHQSILSTIRKMFTAMYSLELGCERTPLFNDAGDNVAKPTDALVKVCKELFNIEPEKVDSISGYHKLYDGKITIIADTGELSPNYMPGHAHNDCLSFEVFYDGNPIFVNLGTYQYQGSKRQYFRTTAAHNTVMIDHHEQSELWGEHRAGRRISNAKGRIIENIIIGQCKNYYGEVHKRKIELRDGFVLVLDKTVSKGKDGIVNSYLHLAPGLCYNNGLIKGNGLNLAVCPINSEIRVDSSEYAPEFGLTEKNECIVFSWKSSELKNMHGYKIIFKEID